MTPANTLLLSIG